MFNRLALRPLRADQSALCNGRNRSSKSNGRGRQHRRTLLLELLDSRRLMAVLSPTMEESDVPGEISLMMAGASEGESMAMIAGDEMMSHMLMGEHFAVGDTFISTHHDEIPRFAKIATDGLTLSVNLRSGNWSDPTIWQAGVVPGQNARVQIASGTEILYDIQSDVRLDAVEVAGQLRFATSTDTRMILDVLMVMPQGSLVIGTAQTPIQKGVLAELVFRGDTALKTGTVEAPGIDPKQYGKGLISFGAVTMHGQQVEKGFASLTANALAGDSSVRLAVVPEGWQAGDRVVIPDTRQIAFDARSPLFTSQAEELQIVAIEGQQVKFASPLKFDHVAPTATQNELFPHLANLTRNIVVRSEAPDVIGRRGHVMFMHRADIDVRYAKFQGLGRTSASLQPSIDNTTYDAFGNVTAIGKNQGGRYSVHFHHTIGPMNPTNTGYQGELVGTVIEDFMKWGVDVHQSHYMLIQDNVAYSGHGNSTTYYTGAGGAAFATETGNESFNVFEGNFVLHTKAGSTQRIKGSAGEGGIHGSNGKAESISRDGFWFRGQHNYVRDNVVTNAPDFAYNYNGQFLKEVMPVPKFRGANMHDPDQVLDYNPTMLRDGTGQIIGIPEGLPVLESARNSAYGATGQGLWLQRPQGHIDRINSYSDRPSVFKDYNIWHVTEAGVYHWGQDRLIELDGFRIYNDPAISAKSDGRYNVGLTFGDIYYAVGQLIVRNFDVRGFNLGVQLPHSVNDYLPNTADVAFFENGTVENHVNFEDRYTRWSSEKLNVISNVNFKIIPAGAANSIIPPQPLNIWMHPDTRDSHSFAANDSRLLVYKFNGEVDNNFQLYFEQQAPNYVIPAYRVRRGLPDDTLPGVGLTNQEAWNQFGVAIGAAVAPSQSVDGDDGELAASRAANHMMKGLLFPFVGNPPQPSVRQPQVSITSPQAGATIDTATVSVKYSLSGDTSQVAHLAFRLDGGADLRETSLDGVFVVNDVSNGAHVLEARLVDKEGKTIGDASTIRFEVLKQGTSEPTVPETPPASTLLDSKWSFAEGTGVVAGDTSGNNHQALLSPTVTWVDGKLGGGLRFDGQTSVVNAGDLGHHNQVTVAAWVKPEGGGGSVVVSKTQGQHEWELTLSDAGYAYFNVNGTSTGTYVGKNHGEWVHLAATYDQSTIRLYRNGELVSSRGYQADINYFGNSIGIGRRASGSGAAFAGGIDEVQLFGRALSADDVNKLFNAVEPIPVPAPVPIVAQAIATWGFAEGTGAVASDTSGNGHQATLSPTVTWADGKLGGGLHFDGQTSVVNAGDLGHHNQVTVAAWVKPEGGGGSVIVSKTQGQYEWELTLSDSGYAYFNVNGTSTGAYVGKNHGEWMHLAATYDQSTIRLYRNGELVSSRSYQADINYFGNSVGIGRRVSGGGAAFAGVIDEVSLFRRALSEDEVSQLQFGLIA